MLIAVDFDGTIVEDRYPKIGDPKIFAFETLREIHKNRHNIILWTTRTGQELEEAVEYCSKNGVEFYGLNTSYPEEKYDPEKDSRKIICDVFVSHRNIGGMKSWGEIWQDLQEMESAGIDAGRKRPFLSRLFGGFSKK